MPKTNTPTVLDTQANPAPLQELAATIRTEHGAIIQSVNDTLGHVLAAGRALIAARSQVPKNEWTSWLTRNCEVGDRHARRYVALTQAYEASGHTVSGDLVGQSLRGLMRKLTPPKSADTPRSSVGKKATARGLSVTAWDNASPHERRSFIDAIGWAPLAEAIPPTWWPTIAKRFEAHSEEKPAADNEPRPGRVRKPRASRQPELAA